MFDALLSPFARVLLILGIALSLASMIWLAGAEHVQRKWDHAETRTELATAQLREAKARQNTTIVTRFVDRVVKLREVGTHNAKEATAHVTPEADAACAVSAGFVRLQGNPSTAAGTADAAPSGIPLSRVGAIIAINYARGLENIEQVNALQDYITVNCSPANSGHDEVGE
jgi:hypothetical protein